MRFTLGPNDLSGYAAKSTRPPLKLTHNNLDADTERLGAIQETKAREKKTKNKDLEPIKGDFILSHLTRLDLSKSTHFPSKLLNLHHFACVAAFILSLKSKLKTDVFLHSKKKQRSAGSPRPENCRKCTQPLSSPENIWSIWKLRLQTLCWKLSEKMSQIGKQFIQTNVGPRNMDKKVRNIH